MLMVVGSVSAARVWVPEQMMVNSQPFLCGEQTSLAMYLGTQPVVCARNPQSSPATVRRSPFGWESFSRSGYIAGDGGRNILDAAYPVNYSSDGYFYSAGGNNPGSRPMSFRGGSWYKIGPEWTYSTSSDSNPCVAADPTGRVYMAAGYEMAMSLGSSWSTPRNLNEFNINRVSDLSISCHGEPAVSGYGPGGEKMVAWFDFKTAGWHTRTLASQYGFNDTIGVEWDTLGNLGVAYTPSNSVVKFDFLDIETGLWSSEVAYSNANGGFLGAALAYDRFDLPVIASGQYLIYDPPAVPEPCMLLLMLGSLGLLGRKIRRQ